MKLHLPKLLRNSVLACITAVAGIATSTLGTATFAGGVVAFTLVGQQALADVTISDSQTWDADSDGDLGVVSVAGASANLTISGGTHSTGDKFELKNGGNATISGGKLTVERIMLHNAWANTQETLRIEGGVVNVQGTELGINTSAAVVIGHWPGSNSQGKLTLEGDGVLNVLNGGVVVGWDSVGSLEIAGGTANLKSVYLNRGTLDVTGGRLNVLAGGSIGQSSNAANGFVVSGGTVSLGEGAVINSAITLSGSAILETTSSSVAIGENVSIDLSGYASTTGAGDTIVYTILTGSGNKDLSSLSLSNVEVGTYKMGKNWTFGTDGTISYNVTSKDVVWSDGNTLSWMATGTEFSTGGEFANGDNVTISTSADVAIGEGGVQASNVIIQGEGTVVKLTNNQPIYVGNQLIVKDGAVLALNTESGESGVIRAESSGYGGEIVVENGGVLRFNAKDVTGYSGGNNSTKSIHVQSGGTLELNHANNETFAGTLNLDGVLKGIATNGSSRWDLYNGNAVINVGANATAKMENVTLCLRRENAVVTVGDGGRLIIDQGVEKGDRGNGILVKEGAGALVIQGETSNAGFTINGGSVEMTNAEECDMTISGAAGTTFTKNGEGTINAGSLNDYGYQGAVVLNGGAIHFTGSDTEDNTNTGFVNLVRNLTTNEDSYVKIDGNVLFNYTDAGGALVVDMNSNVEITGRMLINSNGSTGAPDGDSMRRWNVNSSASLSVGDELWLTNNQKLVLNGGAITVAGDIKLGHNDNGVNGAYKAKLQIDSGSLSAAGIVFYGGHNSVLVRGGTLDFAPATAELLSGGSENNTNKVEVLGGTLKASTANWTLTGSSAHNVSLGNVIIDVANAKTAMLAGSIGLTGTIQKTGNGTLQLADDIVLSVDNIVGFKKSEAGIYTDFDGYTTSGNGFFAGDVQLIEGAYTKAGSMSVLLGGKSITNCVENAAGLAVNVGDNSTYFVNTGTVTLRETKQVDAFHIASGAVLAYESGDFSATLSGSGTYRPASVMQTDQGAYMTPGITLSSDWMGTVEIVNSHIMGVNFNSLGTAQSNLKVVGLGTWIHTSHKDIKTNLVLENYSAERSALIITDSSSGNEYEFNGAVSGSGDFEIATRANSACSFLFAGDTSAWSGDIFASTSYNGGPYTESVNFTPNFTVKLTGKGDIFDPTGESVIKMNRAGTMYLQIGNETESSTLNASIDKNAGNIEITINHGDSKTAVAKAVNATKLTANGYGEFLENVTLSGNITFNNNQSNHLVLHGDNNVASVVDLSNGNTAAGVLELKKGASLTSRNTLWLRPGASILLQEDASINWDDTKVIGRAGSSQINSTTNANQWMDRTHLQVMNADFQVSKSQEREIAALLQNSSVINAGTGLVTVTNADNTLTGVEAKGGNIVVQNTTTGRPVSLGAIVAADNKSVTAQMAQAQVSAITLGAGASFSTNGALTVTDGSALSLGADAGVSMNGALTLGSGLVLTVSDVTKDTTLFSGVTSMATSLDDITAYISSINGLTDLSDYTLELDGTNLVLVVDKGKTVNWSTSNSIWEDGAQFGATAEDVDKFVNGDVVVFGALEANEEVTIKGEIHALSMDVAAGADKTYTFASDVNGGTLTVHSLSITSGTAVFGANTLNVDALSTVVVDGVLDLSSMTERKDYADLMKKLALATGAGKLKLGSGWGIINDLEVLEFGVDMEVSDAFEVLRSDSSSTMDWNVQNTITVNDGTVDGKNGDVYVGNNVNLNVKENGVINAVGVIDLGHSTQGGNTGSCFTLSSGGAVKVSAITQANSSSFTMSGGTLELTGTGGIASAISTTITGGTLVANEASWSITGATIGGATIGGNGALSCAVQIQTAGLDTDDTDDDNAITLTNATLTGTLDNAAGKLVLAGATNITSSGYKKVETLTSYKYGENGYATTDTYYQLVTTAGNLTVDEGATFTVDGSSTSISFVTDADSEWYNWVKKTGTDYGTVYYVRDGAVSYSASDNQFDTATQLLVNGGSLTLSTSLGGSLPSTNAIRVETPLLEGGTYAATLTVGKGVILGVDQLSVKTGVLLAGAGVYDIANAQTLRSGVKLGTAWEGTVKLTGTSLGGMNLDALGNAASSKDSVEFCGVTGHLSQNGTYFTNLILTNGADDAPAWKINNGWGGDVRTFKGTISGTGDIQRTAGTGGSQAFTFSGDISEWSGAVKNYVTMNDTIFKITGSTEIKASFDSYGSDNKRYNLQLTIDDATIADTVTDKTVSVTGSVNVSSLTLGLAEDTADTRATVNLNNSVTVNTLTNYANTTLSATHTELVESEEEGQEATEQAVANVLTVTTLTNSGTLTVNGTLADGAAVTNSGTLKLTQDAATLESLAGAGSVEANALTITGAATGGNDITADSLALQAATNTVGDLTLSGALTLGVAATDTAAGTVSTLTATTLSIGGDVVVNKLAANLISAGAAAVGEVGQEDYQAAVAGLASGSKLNFAITESELLSYMNTNSVTSLTLATIQGLDLAAVSLNKVEGTDNRWDAGTHSWDTADGQYAYVLSVTDGVLTLSRENLGVIWNGAEGQMWLMDDTSDQVADTKSWKLKGEEASSQVYTNAESVIFDGSGFENTATGQIEVTLGGQKVNEGEPEYTLAARNVTINAEGKTYLFEGTGLTKVVETTEVTDEETGATTTVTTEKLEIAEGTGAVLKIANNLSVNAGTLIVGKGLTIGANVRTEVLEKGELVLQDGAQVYAYSGIVNNGTVTIGEGNENGITALYVQPADATGSKGSVTNAAGATMNVEGLLLAGYGAGEYAGDGYNIYNYGTLVNTGTILADGSLVNTGVLTQTAGGLSVAGNLSNTGANIEAGEDGSKADGLVISGGYASIGGDLTNSAGMSISGGAIEYDDGLEIVEYDNLAVRGTLGNSGTVAVTGEGTAVTVGSLENSGTVSISAGSLNLTGMAETVSYEVSTKDPETQEDIVLIVTDTDYTSALLDNTDGTLNIADGADVTVSAVRDANGELVLDEDGNSYAGRVVNDGGTITIGGELVAGVDAEGKEVMVPGTTMLVEGDLDNTNGTIIIGSAATETTEATYGSLTVTGDLTHAGDGSQLTVESGSELTVGGDLAAAGMELAFGGNVTVGGNVSLGSLENNGVFKTTSTADDASVSIGSLSGSGELNVAGGTLYIGSQVDFTGSLTGDGKLVAGTTGGAGFTLLTRQDAVMNTAEATDITAASVTVSGLTDDAGEWVSANGSILGDVATNSIVIDVLDTAATPHLTLNSLTGKLDDADTDDTVAITLTELGSADGVAKLIEAGVADYHLLSINGATTGLTLVDNLSDADEQQLWKSGLKLGDLAVTTPLATTAVTNVSLSVLKQTQEEATWDTAGETTAMGLELGTLSEGIMVLKSNDMLDNVQQVKVTADTKLDLSSDDTAAVNIQALTGAKNLSIAGNGDTVNITTATAGYAGTLSLDEVEATVSGTVETLLAGSSTAADLEVDDTVVVVKGTGVELTGSMEGGSLVLADGATVTGSSDLSIDDTKLGITKTDKGNTLKTATGDATIVLADLGSISGSTSEIVIGQYDEKSDSFVQSALYAKYFDLGSLRLEDGKVLAERNSSYYSDSLSDSATSENGAVGLAMADEVLKYTNAQATNSTGDLAAVLDQLDAYIATGNRKAADELGASLAGASTAVLGMAAAGDVDRQLRAIRNRTTTMGVDQSVVNADMPYVNAWINAEGDNREMNDDGTLGGYKLNSWGGTVGFDVDIDPTFTAGMALTAMYGDLDATGADKATGELDTTYVSAFARYAGSAWTHTFVATVGLGDISLDRTVLGRQLKGETESVSFGLMYEVGRVYALDEDGTACLQPVFNVAWRHTTVDAYTEKGGELALDVEEQSLNTITFGVGARLQAVVGESMYNRTSIFEARVLVKADAGDREGTAGVALADSDAESRDVTSAEAGAIGLEVGAGLTIPLGDEGSSIFMDASAELRADYTNVNGTVGYRINF